jgi:cyclopropane fatty-acyl-phospholipid synthase-like methyltransferase
MSRAVGSAFEEIGFAEIDMLKSLGLGPGKSLIDVGCGSGRLSSQLTKQFGNKIAYCHFSFSQRSAHPSRKSL